MPKSLMFIKFFKDFGICFFSAFRRLKTAQEAPKIAPRRPKKLPRGAQDGPRGPQDGPRELQDGPKTAEEGLAIIDPGSGEAQGRLGGGSGEDMLAARARRGGG